MGLINSKRNASVAQTERDEVKFSNPNGLYPTCSWDLKVVKKLILEKKLAPFYPGNDEKTSNDADECPICFLFYTGGLNNSRCCKKGMCTECFLQVKKPNIPLSDSTCPFCNRTKFTVIFTGPKPQEERQKEEEEEQRVLMLQQKMREEEIERDKEREKQRQAQKGKEKAKPSGPAQTEGGKGKEIVHTTKGNNDRRNKSVGEPSGSTERETSPAVIPASYPPVAQGGGSSPEKDLEELMLMEAIRLSLMESGDKQNSPRKENKGNEGPSSPFSELFGAESEGNDFESKVKSVVRRPTHSDEEVVFDSDSEKEKEDEALVSRARRARTPSTTVPIEETPLGKSDEGN